MLMRILQRYAVAAVAFMIGAAVTGIALVAAAECLGVFSGVYVAAAAYQQRQLALQRRPRSRRPRVVEEDEVVGWPSQAVDWPSATWNG